MKFPWASFMAVLESRDRVKAINCCCAKVVSRSRDSSKSMLALGLLVWAIRISILSNSRGLEMSRHDRMRPGPLVAGGLT